MKKKIWEGFLTFLIFAVLAVVFTWPVGLHLGEKLIGDGGDNLQFFGRMRLVEQNLSLGKWPFSDTNNWRYPGGFEFSRSADSYLLYVMGILSLGFVKNWVLHYNLLILTLFVLNAVCAYPLFKHLGKSKFLGVLGATTYGFSFQALARNGGHPNLMFTGGFPLFVYSLLKLLEGKKTKAYLALMGFSVLLTGFGSMQYLLILVGALPLVMLTTWMFYKEELKNYFAIVKNYLGFLLMLLVLFGGVFLVFSWPTLRALVNGDFVAGHGSLQDLYFWSPSVLDYIRPNQYLKLWYGDWFAVGEKVGVDWSLFLGWVEMILFATFLSLKRVNKKIKVLAVALIGIFWVMSLGVKSLDIGILLPYALLVKVFPYWGVAEATRWYIVFYLFVAMAGVMALENILKSRGWLAKVLGFAILGLVIGERWGGNFNLTSMEFSKLPYVEVVKQLPGQAVLDLPVDLTWSSLGASYDVLPFYYGKKTVNGYIHWSADTDEARRFLDESGAYRFMCDNENRKYFEGKDLDLNKAEERNEALFDYLRKNDIKTIVLHKQPESHLYFPEECGDVLAEVTKLLPRVIEIKGTSGPTQMEMRRFRMSNIDYRLYFAKGGIFRLNRMHYAQKQEGSGLELFVDGKKVDVADWANHSNFEWGRWTKRTIPSGDSYEVKIEPGSVVRFYSDEFVEGEGFLNAWYQFEEDEQSVEVPMGRVTENLEKIYEDTDKEVWLVH